MIGMIKQEPRLADCLKKDYEKPWLEDEGIFVQIDASLGQDDYAAVKVDGYYNGLRVANPPKAIDFLVAVDCQCDCYALYLLEFKNVKSPKYLDIPAIQEKFSNTLSRFMQDTFSVIFCNDRFKYRRIWLYLVSDPYGIREKYPEARTFTEYQRLMERMGKKDSLKTDISLSVKPFRFRGKLLSIQFDIPPNPLIRRIT